MKTLIRPAVTLFVLMTLITGLAYPLIVTGVAQTLFPDQAAGSLIRKEGQVVGSALIGQPFTASRYFWGRPSATPERPDNAASSAGSNLGPLNPALVEAVKQRVEALKKADPGNVAAVPVDLVTASGSGLDPHISVAAAQYQAQRIARERGWELDAVQRLIAQHTQGRLFGLLGEPRINVLALNLALDRMAAAR